MKVGKRERERERERKESEMQKVRTREDVIAPRGHESYLTLPPNKFAVTLSPIGT